MMIFLVYQRSYYKFYSFLSTVSGSVDDAFFAGYKDEIITIIKVPTIIEIKSIKVKFIGNFEKP